MNFVKKVAAAAAALALAAAPAAAQVACSAVTAPTLDESLTSISGQDLVVTVHAPATYDTFTVDWDRSDIVFDGTDECSLDASHSGDEVWGKNNNANGGQYWTIAATGTCTGDVAEQAAVRTYTFTRNLADSLSACVFTNLVDEVFDNTLTFTATNSTNGVFGTGQVRTDQTSNSIQITFPTTATATAGANTFGGAITYGALTASTINLDAGAVTTSFVTSVQYPYQLKVSPAVSDDTANWNIATDATPVNSASCSVEGQACQQTWTLPITKVGTPCAVDGEYTITFEIDCFPGFEGDCAAHGQDNVPLTFSLSSESFCPQVVEVATVVPTMTLYASTTARDAGPGNEAADYIFGTMLFARADFAVEGGVALTGSRLLSLDIDNQCTGCTNNGDVPVVVASVAQAVASTIDFASEAAPGAAATVTPNRYDFQYRLTTGSVVFDNDLTTGNAVQTLTATFQIDYDTAVNQKRQRIMRVPVRLAAAGTSVGTSASATFRASSAGSSSSTSQATVLGVSQGTVIAVGVALGAVAIIAVGAAVAVKRRAASSAGASNAKKIQASSSSAALELGAPAGAASPQVGTGDLRTVQTAYDATQA